jgi:hypothetical protein
VITLRFESLKYEIYQYLNGVPLDRLDILSRKQLWKRGIQIRSFNDIEKSLLQEEAKRSNIDIFA